MPLCGNRQLFTPQTFTAKNSWRAEWDCSESGVCIVKLLQNEFTGDFKQKPLFSPLTLIFPLIIDYQEEQKTQSDSEAMEGLTPAVSLMQELQQTEVWPQQQRVRCPGSSGAQQLIAMEMPTEAEDKHQNYP